MVHHIDGATFCFFVANPVLLEPAAVRCPCGIFASFLRLSALVVLHFIGIGSSPHIVRGYGLEFVSCRQVLDCFQPGRLRLLSVPGCGHSLRGARYNTYSQSCSASPRNCRHPVRLSIRVISDPFVYCITMKPCHGDNSYAEA